MWIRLLLNYHFVKIISLRNPFLVSTFQAFFVLSFQRNLQKNHQSHCFLGFIHSRLCLSMLLLIGHFETLISYWRFLCVRTNHQQIVFQRYFNATNAPLFLHFLHLITLSWSFRQMMENYLSCFSSYFQASPFMRCLKQL